MAEETKAAAAPEAPKEEVVISDVPVAETTTAPLVVEKEAQPKPKPEPEPMPEPEAVAQKPAEEAAAAEGDKEKAGEEKITEPASFKEETNVAGELPDPQKKALDEFKQLVQEALSKREFTAPPPPPQAPKEEEKKAEPETAPAAASAEEPKAEDKKETEAESKTEEAKESEAPTAEVPPPVTEEPPKAEAKPVVETPPPPPLAAAEPSDPAVVAEKVQVKTEAVDEDGAKTVEEIKETIVEVTNSTPAAPEAAAPAEEPSKEEAKEVTEEPPKAPEEVSIWGIPLLADEKSDTILLKFLRARDFKVKDAFTMLKNVVAWRKEFEIEKLLEEGIGSGLEKVVHMHGVDKEGHPVCYNAYGEFQDKELYQNTFADAEKRSKFLRWRIQFLENSIRKLDFSPDGVSTIVQVNDLKNSPGLFLFKKELRQATNQAVQLLQDNYPEFVAKQVFINVPWWYVAYNRMISPFLTQRTKSKFVFAGPSKTAETLLKYIAPEQVPVQYGGLSREGEQEFTTADPATEETIKPSSKQTVEFLVTEACTLVWEVRVVGWEVSYGAEFVPSAEGGYTLIVQKSRKQGPTDEPVISGSFKIGEPGKVVLTFDNQTSKKKKLLYRSKTKPSD